LEFRRVLFRSEALHELGAIERLGDDSGGWQATQFFDCHTIGIGHVNYRLPLPVRQRLRDIWVRLVTDSQKDNVRLDDLRQCSGNDFGSDRGSIGCKAFRVASGCNGYFNAASGKRLSKRLADLTEANNCVVHRFTFDLSSLMAFRLIEWSAV